MPEPYRKYGEMWSTLNDGWVVTDWTEAALRTVWNGQMPCQEIWDRLETEALAPVTMRHAVAVATQRADILGYALVHQFGGVYVNCDLEPLRPLKELPLANPDREAWACYEDRVFLNNGAMGGPKGHPFFGFILDRLPAYYDARKGLPMNWTTGPRLLTDSYGDWRISAGFTKAPVVALPRRLFHFASYGQVPIGGDASAFRGEAYKQGAIALHHWGHKWQIAQA